MMRKLAAFVLGLALYALPLASNAAVTVFQTKDCSTTAATTCAFASAPTNGHVVIVAFGQSGAACATTNVTDSHAAAVTLVVTNVQTNCSGIAAYTVSGTPTATYTFSVASFASLLEVSATTGTQSSNIGGATPQTTPALGSSILGGGIVLCVNSTVGTAVAPTSSAGALTGISTGASFATAYAVLASTTASVTCTGTDSAGKVALSQLGANQLTALYPGQGMVGLVEPSPPSPSLALSQPAPRYWYP